MVEQIMSKLCVLICLLLHLSLPLSLAQTESGESTQRLSGRLQGIDIDSVQGLSSNNGGERRLKLDLNDGETSLTLLVRPGSVWTNTSSLVVLFQEKNIEYQPNFSVDNNCILTGRVESSQLDPSVVSLNICNGVTGIVQLGRLDYFITSKTVLQRALSRDRSYNLHVRVVRNTWEIQDTDDAWLIPEIKAQREQILNVSKDTIVSGTIEVGLFLDKSIMTYLYQLGFDSPTKIGNYLITKWNFVNTIYSNVENVGSDVTIKVKYIEMWSRRNPVWYQPYEDLTHLGKLLRGFCKNVPKHKLDHKMLYTRGTDNGIMGMAYVGGVCDKIYKCSVVRVANSRLYYARTEMHELGHNLGLPHDKKNTPCGSVAGFMGQGVTYEFMPCYKSIVRNTIRSKVCLRRENVKRRLG